MKYRESDKINSGDIFEQFMQGPFKKLKFNPDLFKDWEIFEPHKTYLVTRSFTDFDGDEIIEGFTFEFLGCIYFPYDDELLMNIRDAAGHYYDIKLAVKSQKSVLENLVEYFRREDGN